MVTQPKDSLESPKEVTRPGVFSRENGPTPPTAKLELVPPPGFEEMGVRAISAIRPGDSWRLFGDSRWRSQLLAVSKFVTADELAILVVAEVVDDVVAAVLILAVVDIG